MIKKISLILLSFCFITLIRAEGASDRVQAKLNAIQGMQANFSQIVKAGKRQISTSTGSMALVRPGRFRWETKSPMAQIIVADGAKLWIYDVELEQVTVKKQEKGIGGTPALFLSGYDDTVARDFTVQDVSKGKQQQFILHAKSPKENYQEVTLTFDGERLVSISFHDQLGQDTQVQLSAIKANIKLSPQLFKFNPPKGVDVIEQ